MAMQDAFEDAEQSVLRYSLEFGGKSIHVYEIKLSNAEDVLRQCLSFVQKQVAHEKQYILMFNAKHVKPQHSNLMRMKKILNDHTDLLFSPKLTKFAIMVKSFITNRRVIEVFDEIFDEAGMSRDKYNYFSVQDKEKVLQWLATGK